MITTVRTHLFSSGFAAAGGVMLAGSVVINATNYIFTLIMGRLLGIGHFGEVSALMGLLVIVTVPASALSLFMAREVAGHDAHRSHALHVSLRAYAFVASVCLWVIFFALSPIVAAYLNITLMPVIIFSMLLPLSLLTAQQSGAMQGLYAFVPLSLQGVIQSAIKLFASIVLVMLGYAVAGVMTALLISSIIAWIYGMIVLSQLFARRKKHADATVTYDAKDRSGMDIARIVGTFFYTALLLALLSNIDVVLAKHYLTAEVAGQYAALSTIGKIIVYALGIAGTILLPMASSAHARSKREAQRLAFFVIGGVALCAALSAGIFAFFSHFIVSLLFGLRYITVTPYLGFFAVGMAAISVSTTLVNYFIATHDRGFLVYFTVGIIAETLFIVLHHATIAAMTLSLTSGALVLLILLGIHFTYSTWRTPDSTETLITPTV